jgi:hypothetical protein
MNTSFALLNLGGGEIILILALILIVYGAGIRAIFATDWGSDSGREWMN